jgi:predicted ATPase/class 3 adenylate cyclase
VANNGSQVTSDLPSGMVTFVFTDIEGSTRLLRQLGDGYAVVLRRHQELLRRAWQDHGGHEMETEGDSFFVAFADPATAIRAATDAQRNLRNEPWPDGGDVRVRIGIHTGLASPHRDQYVALAVHQAARIVDAAHGAQTLVTADTVDALEVADDLSLRSLGRFRVRDFDDPVELFRIDSTAEAGDDRPPRVLPADRHNLLRPLAELIDRETDLDTLVTSVHPGQAVTLVGPGGVGKTRLAVECGLRLLDRWNEGVWFVDLAVVEEPSLVARTVAQAMGVHVPSDGDPVECLVAALGIRPALLIIDNAEHLRQAVAQLVKSIVQRCRTAAVMTTSRERLGVAGEIVHQLGPLPSHRRSNHHGHHAPAVQLFCRRAANLAARWTPADLDEIAVLCQQLDGLPLAIEMAAARTSAHSLAEIRSGVERRSGRLATDDPTAGSRHRSLDHLLAWSDDLLSVDERAVFHHLGVFTGTFSTDLAAAAVGGASGLDTDDVPELIWSLANKSLVSVEPAAGATRYRLLATVRSFTRQRCGPDESRATARRLAIWYLDRIGPDLPLDLAWTGQMADEIDNLRGLIPALVEPEGALAQRLACSIGQYLDLKQEYAQGIDEIDRYTHLVAEPTPERVGLLTRLAGLHLRVGDVDAASAVLRVAFELQQQVGRTPWDDVSVERAEGELALRRGEHAEAAAIAERVLSGDPSLLGQGRMWNLLGISRCLSSDFAGAAVAFDREVASWKALGREALLVSAHGNLAEALLRLGDRPKAAHHQLLCLELAMQYGQPLMVAYSAMVAAHFGADEGEWANAVSLQNFANAELDRIGFVMYPADRQASDDLLAEAKAHLEMYQTTTDSASTLDVRELFDLTAESLRRASQRGEVHNGNSN